MFKISRYPKLLINRNLLIAATPIFFLLLLGLWTIFNANVQAVKAQPFSNSVFATVKRNSANLREGPGTQYRILGQSLKGASLPVLGKFDNEFGQRWYEVYLRAFGNVWISGTVVIISPANAEIAAASPNQSASVEGTAIPTDIPAAPQTSNNSNNNNNPPAPTSVPSQPTSAPPTSAPPPITTPEVNG